MENIVHKAREVEMDDGTPRLDFRVERVRTEEYLEVLDHGRFAGLGLTC